MLLKVEEVRVEKEGLEAGRVEAGGGGAGCREGVVEDDRELLADLQGCQTCFYFGCFTSRKVLI